MKRFVKLLTFWIPVRAWRHWVRDHIESTLIGMIPLNKNWVIMYDTFSKSGNGDSIRPLAIELRKRKPNMKFFFVSKTLRDIDMADEVLVIGSKRYEYIITRAKYLFSPMDLPSTKRKGQIWVMLWHGSPLKKIYHLKDNSQQYESYTNLFLNVDYFCLISKMFLPVLSNAFKLDKNIFVNTGIPRNDVLIYGNNKKYIEKIKHDLNIPLDKKVLFYCPTWRRYDWKQPMPFDIVKIKKSLGSEYVLLMRSHVGKHDWVDKDGNKISFDKDDFIYDVGSYENISELYLISDVLITDYSSSIFDYAILERPQILYAYDLDAYESEYGFVFDYNTFSPFPIVKTEKDLIKSILDAEKQSKNKLKNFHKKYAEYQTNNSTNKIINLVFNNKKVNK